ncbi:MAG TPA: YoaK family protein [Phycisphaerales bacterium]
MFIAQAHSYYQQARLAVTLAWIAGYTNILTILVCGHVTSHVSGTTSDLGRAVVEARWETVGFLLYLLVSFFIGAGIAGFAAELGKRRRWESIYVLPIAIEAALLAAFAIALEFFGPEDLESRTVVLALLGIASTAMGLQNATITRISSGVVRTTHVTGVLTDLGLEAVQFLWFLKDERRTLARGRPLDSARMVYRHATSQHLMVLGAVVGSFALGAGLGTTAYLFGTRWAMFPPVFFLLWIIYQDVSRPIAEIEESELEDEDLGLPPEILVYHVRKDHARAGKIHRMPNLLVWADLLPSHAKVVILDLDEVTQLDENSAIELRAAVQKFEDQSRHLIISGVTPDQFAQLNEAAGGGLDPMSACSDLELAIARGLTRL